jgi:hypothetical protein
MNIYYSIIDYGQYKVGIGFFSESDNLLPICFPYLELKVSHLTAKYLMGQTLSIPSMGLEYAVMVLKVHFRKMSFDFFP